MTRPDHPLVATVYDPVVALADRAFLGRYREDIADGLSGRVLDLGAGTGKMFPHFDAEAIEELFAIEPDSSMQRRGIKRATDSDIEPQWLTAVGEALPLQTNSVDYVVSSLVLCTVTDPETVIGEITRVLRDGGELRVLEHIRSNGLARRFQQHISPCWRRVAGGCHPHRQTDRLLADDTLLAPVETRRVYVGIPPIRPHFVGRYRASER